MRHTFTYLALMLGLAAPANALSIPSILCEMGNGKIADNLYVHDADDDQLPGMTTFIETRLEGDDDSVTHVIAHCATRQMIRYGDDLSDTANTMLRAAIEGDTPVPLNKLATKLKQEGVDARYGKLPKRHCACKPETHKPSF